MQKAAMFIVISVLVFYTLWIITIMPKGRRTTIDKQKVVPYTGNLSICSDPDLDKYWVIANEDSCKRQSIQNSSLFKEKWDPKVPLTWNQQSMIANRSSLEYVWWLSLQSGNKNEDINSIVSKLFEMGFPKDQPKNMIKKDNKCTRCAVVGSSSNLREGCYGKAIDDHDIVIRFNKAPVGKFCRFVGNKTTYRFAYPESSIPVYPLDSTLFLIPFKPKDVVWLSKAVSDEEYTMKSYAPIEHRIEVNISQTYVMHPAFMKYMFDKWAEHSGKHPSTGLMGVLFALHRCSEVNLFGFGADSNGEWQHYYETYIRGATSQSGIVVHNISKEQEVLNHLKKNHLIKIYT